MKYEDLEDISQSNRTTGSGEITKYWFCPLFFFEGLNNPILLSDNITIGRLEQLPSAIREHLKEIRSSSDDDFNNLFNKKGNAASWAIWIPHDNKFEPLGESLSSATDFSTDTIEKIFVSVLTTLRLCHKGIVFPGEIIFINQSPSGIVREMRFFSYLSKEYDGWTLGNEYLFTQSDIPIVNKLFEEIKTCYKITNNIDIALKRFNLSYSSDNESKIIDQMIAFESLFLGDNKELNYILAIRTAFFLGKHKIQIFNDMKQAYSYRSTIVHGNKSVDKSKLEEITPKTEEYLRQSIRKFLLLLPKYSLKHIKEQYLDHNVLKR
jgi:hypothetical protein